MIEVDEKREQVRLNGAGCGVDEVDGGRSMSQVAERSEVSGYGRRGERRLRQELVVCRAPLRPTYKFG